MKLMLVCELAPLDESQCQVAHQDAEQRDALNDLQQRGEALVEVMKSSKHGGAVPHIVAVVEAPSPISSSSRP